MRGTWSAQCEKRTTWEWSTYHQTKNADDRGMVNMAFFCQHSPMFCASFSLKHPPSVLSVPFSDPKFLAKITLLYVIATVNTIILTQIVTRWHVLTNSLVYTYSLASVLTYSWTFGQCSKSLSHSIESWLVDSDSPIGLLQSPIYEG